MFKLLKAFIRWNWNLDHGGMDAIAAKKPITHAVQKGTGNPYVEVYSGTSRLFSKSGELTGYTSNSVSVRIGTGHTIATYDLRGRQISSVGLPY